MLMFSHFSISRCKQIKSKAGGFGLIELLVSISIMVVIVSVVLVQQTSFNGSVLLRSQAYEIALQLRDVQLNAVSATSETGSDFRSVVGVHFNTSVGSDATYRIFRDLDADNFHDVNEEFGLQGLLDERFEIRTIRPIGDTYEQTGGLSIIFERPNFDARFYDSNGEVTASVVEIDVARRDVSGSSASVLRTLEVTAAGQISVQ